MKCYYWREFDDYWLEVITDKNDKKENEIIDIKQYNKPYQPVINKNMMIYEK